MKDDVLRCMAHIKDSPKGFVGSMVDTIDDGDYYTLVFEWAQFPDREGEVPKRTVSIQKSFFDHTSSLDTGYELILKKPLDLTQLEFRDVKSSSFDITDTDLHHPRPNDDASG